MSDEGEKKDERAQCLHPSSLYMDVSYIGPLFISHKYKGSANGSF